MTLKEVVTRLKKCAEDNDIEPCDVTLSKAAKFGVSERQIRNHGGLSAIKKAYFPVTTKNLVSSLRTRKEGKYVEQLEKQLSQKLLENEEIVNALKNIPEVRVKEFKVSRKNKIRREVTIVLSDLHIGSDISKETTGGLDFGKVEEARRLAKITQEVIKYKPQYRNETALNVLLLGDVIQNSLHDPRDGAPVAEQSSRAIYLLNQMLGRFSSNFPRVKVMCATGNHGRNTGRHFGRAVTDKYDSIETIVYYALKRSLSHLKNITVEIPKTPFTSYEVFGKKIFATHGDSVMNPGYPGKAIKTGTLENQINKINAVLEDKQEYSVFIVGHVHTGSITHLGNGSVMITNGALVPSDQYAVSIGLLENTCGQFLFESVEGFPVGDTRFIKVSVQDDKNKELDKIITPFKEL